MESAQVVLTCRAMLWMIHGRGRASQWLVQRWKKCCNAEVGVAHFTGGFVLCHSGGAVFGPTSHGTRRLTTFMPESLLQRPFLSPLSPDRSKSHSGAFNILAEVQHFIALCSLPSALCHLVCEAIRLC